MPPIHTTSSDLQQFPRQLKRTTSALVERLQADLEARQQVRLKLRKAEADAIPGKVVAAGPPVRITFSVEDVRHVIPARGARPQTATLSPLGRTRPTPRIGGRFPFGCKLQPARSR